MRRAEDDAAKDRSIFVVEGVRAYALIVFKSNAVCDGNYEFPTTCNSISQS